MIPLNDLKRAVSQDGESDEIGKLVSRVATSGSYILGNEVSKFEKEFAEFLGVGFVSAVASGTDALVIGLRSLGVDKGSKVALTPNAGGYSTTALLEIGAIPFFVDCDSMGRIDLGSLSSILKQSPEIKCVIITHLYGLNSHVKEVSDLCHIHGVKLLEDCAQSTGATTSEKSLGAYGDVATFSFYPTKNLGAIGDAGALATSSKELAETHKKLRQYGWSARYEVGSPHGRNSRMDEIQAAVLRHRLAHLDTLNERRREIWRKYASALGHSSLEIIGRDKRDFVAHLGILVLPQGLRERAKDFLEANGVATSVHYPILDYQQPGWRHLIGGSCPTSENLTQRILTIPLFPELTDREIEEVAVALRALSEELSESV